VLNADDSTGFIFFYISKNREVGVLQFSRWTAGGDAAYVRRIGNESREPLGFLLTYARSYFQTMIVTAGKLAREHSQAGLE
jgi:hypothetical protein